MQTQLRENNIEAKLSYIDALRGIAILGVIAVHVPYEISSDVVKAIINHGAMGVQLFFVASSFTLFRSFNNRVKNEDSPIRNFFLRRFFRIAPMYYIIGIGYYLFQNGLGYNYWLGDQPHISSGNIISNILFIHGINPYWINSLVPGGWSIAVEVMFYAILPFLVSKIRNINEAINFFIISIVMRFFINVLFVRLPFFDESQHLWNEFLFFYFPNQLPVFSLGIIMYLIINRGNVHFEISEKSLMILALLFLFQLFTDRPYFFPEHIMFAIGFVAFGVSLCHYEFRGFINPLLIYIGKVSFSMYLVHFAVLRWLSVFNITDLAHNAFLNFIIRYIVVTSLTVLVSTLTYRIIELPFQNLGKKIINIL